MCLACEKVTALALSGAWSEREQMNKFEIGDKVTFTAEDVGWHPWDQRQSKKTVGTVKGLNNLAGSDLTTVEVDFHDGLGYDRTGVGWCGENQITHAFERDQIVTGTPVYPKDDEGQLTGTVIDPDAITLSGRPILLVQVNDRARYIVKDSATPVRVPEIHKEEETMTKTELVGPAPEPVQGPKYVVPFRRAGDYIKDANGKTFISSDRGSTLSEDEEIAEIVKDALNAKFSVTEPGSDVQDVPVEFVPRTLVHRNTSGEIDFPNGPDLLFAYEVAPGRFWWARSLEAAQRENEGDFDPGWSADEYESLVDVRDPQGPLVVTD